MSTDLNNFPLLTRWWFIIKLNYNYLASSLMSVCPDISFLSLKELDMAKKSVQYASVKLDSVRIDKIKLS